MARNFDFQPKQVREIAWNFPELKRLMIEREQIKQDAKHSPTHTKLAPHPKPSGDIHHPKIHKEKDGAKTAREKLYDNKLKGNSQELKTVFHGNFEKAGLESMSEWAKEMDTQELTNFMEQGYDKVLEEREVKEKEPNQEKDLEQDLKMDDEKTKEIFGDFEVEQEITTLEEKEIIHDKKIEEGLKMDDKESEETFDYQQGLSDFEDNSKDIAIDKRQFPSDDFE